MLYKFKPILFFSHLMKFQPIVMPSWIEDGDVTHNFESGPTKDQFSSNL
jgi:hypothetical protein